MSGEITELLARSLTLEELCDRFVEHPDIAVRVFARRVLEAAIQEREQADDETDY